jgi:hypothetical protein
MVSAGGSTVHKENEKMRKKGRESTSRPRKYEVYTRTIYDLFDRKRRALHSTHYWLSKCDA